ncbi:histidine kinase [Chryseobacterium sp. LC2016-29]|uniref:sensor histidine kinase n=1 Tax=Chryseobacterium sp. LC2016-29 TaxID=2897331 RepID=UPI001E5FB1DF|nr:histidine kinase [Chryseobacterium sp. LC2016-29]MCD0478772.1 histidine kinase [Chryseobacterium sp. LC2016-29]
MKSYKILRLLLNIIFIGFIFLAAANNNDKNIPLGFIFLYNILLFSPAWINNFCLLPSLRRNKSIKWYSVTIIVLITVALFILGQYLRYLYQRFDTSELIDFTPIAATSSAIEGLEKYQYYFDTLPGIIIVMGLMIIGYAIQQFLLKIKKERQIQNQQTIAELNLLKSQISPHFLFNVLNSLYSLSLKKAEETPDVILKLSDILRYSLYESQEKEIPITDEIHMLKTYMDIEQLRVPENTNITFEYQINNSVNIAPMLLLPLIENAFKHGVDSSIDASFISAALICDHKLLTFTCKNSFKESLSKDYGGIGVNNVKKRLELLYPMKHSLEIIKSENVFDVNLEIKF